MEYYSVIKRNTYESVLMRRKNIESIIQSEVREKQILHINAYIWHLETYLQGEKGDTDRREQTCGDSGGRRGWNKSGA